MVTRSLAVLEGLRANDVANTVTSEQQSGSKLLLGVSRNVAADHRQAHAETQALEVAKPKGYQAAPFVIIGQTNKHAGTSDTDQIGNNHGGTARVGPLAADEATSQKSRKLNKTARNLQVLRSQGVEAETSDDQRGELSHVSDRTESHLVGIDSHW